MYETEEEAFNILCDDIDANQFNEKKLGEIISQYPSIILNIHHRCEVEGSLLGYAVYKENVDLVKVLIGLEVYLSTKDIPRDDYRIVVIIRQLLACECDKIWGCFSYLLINNPWIGMCAMEVAATTWNIFAVKQLLGILPFEEEPFRQYQEIVVGHCVDKIKKPFIRQPNDPVKLIRLLMDKGFVISLSTFELACHSKYIHIPELFSLLLSIFPIAEKLYRLAVIDNNSVGFVHQFSLNKQEMDIHSLKWLFIFLVQMKKYKEANILVKTITDIYQREKYCGVDQTRPSVITSVINLEPNKNKINTQLFSESYRNASVILSNTDLCLFLLSDLDKQIKELAIQYGVDFSYLGKLDLKEQHFANGLIYPVADERVNEKCRGSTFNILRTALCFLLNEYGIDTQQDKYVFTGYVDEEAANKLVRSGALFKEFPLVESAMKHGVYSHYIQWWLIACAHKKGFLHLDKRITVKALLTHSVDLVISDDTKHTVWSELIEINADNNIHRYDYSFRSPVHTNCLLLSLTDKPNLCGVFRMIWFRTLRKMQAYISERDHCDEVPSQVLLANQAFSGHAYNLFSVITPEETLGYYKSMARTSPNLRLFEETNIIIKNPPASPDVGDYKKPERGRRGRCQR